MIVEQSREAEGIIPRYSAAEFGFRACPGVHTRDFVPEQTIMQNKWFFIIGWLCGHDFYSYLCTPF
jgi:hypothetical protein